MRAQGGREPGIKESHFVPSLVCTEYTRGYPTTRGTRCIPIPLWKGTIWAPRYTCAIHCPVQRMAGPLFREKRIHMAHHHSNDWC
jgi:hypothetical protein